jgi:hypothetical protein
MWLTHLFPGQISVSRSNRSRTDWRRSPSRRRAARPRLEVLEGRALLSVWTVTDNSDDPNDTGSLRYALKNVPDGTTIEFANNVTSITLTNGPLGIGSNLDIEGPGANVLTISGNNASRVFQVGLSSVTLAGLTVANGSGGGGWAWAAPSTARAQAR